MINKSKKTKAVVTKYDAHCNQEMPSRGCYFWSRRWNIKVTRL